MSRCVDLDERVTAQFYDQECEEWTMQTVTIEDVLDSVCDEYTVLPSAQPECDKEFVMLKVIDLNGRPYYSIIYLEDGREYEGYSSYDLMVISEYLKRYFGFAQPEIIRCWECKLRDTEYCNMAHGFMGMKDDDYCSYAERREVSE